MKNRLYTTTSDASSRGAVRVSHRNRSPKRICIQRKWCLVYGGIGEVSCTSSCFRVVRLLTPRNTTLN